MSVKTAQPCHGLTLKIKSILEFFFAFRFDLPSSRVFASLQVLDDGKLVLVGGADGEDGTPTNKVLMLGMGYGTWEELNK